MPVRDGTGPQGYGPLTGKGMGNCVGSWCPVPGRGFGFGRGRGYRAGYGPGYGRRYHYPVYDEESEILRQEETQMLKAMAKDLTAELEAINKRLNILEEKNSDNTGDE